MTSPLAPCSKPRGELGEPPSSLLDKMTTSGRKANRRTRRAFHRIISGLSKPGTCRFITLTSSNSAPADIERSWRKLVKRLRRRQIMVDYCKVTEHTQSGAQHIHAIVRGKYIEAQVISSIWESIHDSPIIDIRAIKTGRHGRRKVAAYLSKYVSKDDGHRLCPSLGWLYPRASAVWRALVHATALSLSINPRTGLWQSVIDLWHLHLAQKAKLLTLLQQTQEYEVAYFYRLALQKTQRAPQGLEGWWGQSKFSLSLPPGRTEKRF